jgi:hypothetical protein
MVSHELHGGCHSLAKAMEPVIHPVGLGLLTADGHAEGIVGAA